MTDTPKIDNKSFIERIKDQFRPTPISQADDTLFDVCMKCGVRLPDKKLTTLREHQRTEHPLTAKEKRTEFVFKHMLPVLIGIVVILSAGAWALGELEFDPFGLVGDKTTIDVDDCRDRTLALKSRMYEQKEFRSTDADDFNYLLENCNASFWSYRQGETLFETDYYSPEEMEKRGETLTTRYFGED